MSSHNLFRTFFSLFFCLSLQIQHKKGGMVTYTARRASVNVPGGGRKSDSRKRKRKKAK